MANSAPHRREPIRRNFAKSSHSSISFMQVHFVVRSTLQIHLAYSKPYRFWQTPVTITCALRRELLCAPTITNERKTTKA